MINSNWNGRHITDSAQRILEQIPPRAADRGLHVVDARSILMMALWSLLLWERKVGRIALEQVGVDRYKLASGVDQLLDERAKDYVVEVNQQGNLVMVKTGEPYRGWDFDSVLEPLLRQAEHEAMELSHNYVGSEHLVLAILRLADGDLGILLQQHSVTHSRVRDLVLILLGS